MYVHKRLMPCDPGFTVLVLWLAHGCKPVLMVQVFGEDDLIILALMLPVL